MTPPLVTIDLGIIGDSDGTRPASRWPLGRLLAGAVLLVCLFTVTGSDRGTPGLGHPLWTGNISLNGFTLGSQSLYLAAPNGETVASRDLRTGEERWRLTVPELPDSTTDVGGGVAVVAARRLTTSVQTPYGGRLNELLAFVRESTGEVIARTSGYLGLPSQPGLPTVVFTNRPRGAPGCTDPSTACLDVAGWDLTTGSVVWRLSLPSGSRVIEANVGGRTDGLLEIAGPLLRARELVTGAVVGTLSRSASDQGDQLLVVRDAVVVGRREPHAIVLTGYRRPSLHQAWSVSVPAPSISNSQLSGYYAVNDCGSLVCLLVDGRTSQLLDVATGSFSPPIPLELVRRLGDGVLVAVRNSLVLSIRDGRDNPYGVELGGGDQGGGHLDGVHLISPAGRIVAGFPAARLIDWIDDGGRALLARSGPKRTAFTVIDNRGNARELGSVEGVNLTCAARANVLACSNGAGGLRVWRIPAT